MLMRKPTYFRVRFRLSVGSPAIEEVNGLYVSIEDHEQALTWRLAEAERLIRMATQRYPLALTATQCRDAHVWLTTQAG
jgi:hypothetical protein